MKHLVFLMGLFMSLQAQAIQVTVTIPPLAALVQPYLSKGDRLVVLLPYGSSPHHFQFRPSHLKALYDADLILTVGNTVDLWAKKPIQQVLKQNVHTRHIAMQKQPGLAVLPSREQVLLEEHSKEALTQHHHDHIDPHIWLSIKNATLMLKAIGQAWQDLKPSEAQETADKTKQILSELDQLDHEIKGLLKPVKNVPYLVLHDAFYYFEKPYGLNNLGTIQVSTEVKPGIKRVLQLRQLIEKAKVQCVFKEPQFSDNQLTYIISGLNVKIGSLDPMGRFESSKNYVDFMKALAMQYEECLAR
ncbi:zinc ABC transporter substrate-binding protein [Hydrogenovibrio sp. 3SP14C1]|uniref:zinc ABC transporter substrate-binding protein n=1 Tax=Hydrogenovibrio sp. 3SP14C1 TaxID=3038774 RepID=UPI002417608A|nr:zinc ABC transporter substrate-binding protein [Hydrogenovibrio sp. 3SP14C1]MDG4811814.1 zinc ABC transporter substrate-binding protein [Hydrogenovibrio sp. 3SP14C1]